MKSLMILLTQNTKKLVTYLPKSRLQMTSPVNQMTIHSKTSKEQTKLEIKSKKTKIKSKKK